MVFLAIFGMVLDLAGVPGVGVGWIGSLGNLFQFPKVAACQLVVDVGGIVKLWVLLNIGMAWLAQNWLQAHYETLVRVYVDS
jgi:hypothetical protein